MLFPFAMASRLQSTLTPLGFDPDDVTREVFATRVAQASDAAEGAGLHRHETGQLTIATRGLVGVRMEDGIWIIPLDCAVYIPPGLLHHGVLADGAELMTCHIAPSVAGAMPSRPVTFMLNRLTLELVGALLAPLEKGRAERIGAVILDELAHARLLPVNFATMPEHPVLRRIAQECVGRECCAFTAADWARRVNMTEKTLSRLVMAETGTTFKQWRQRLRFLASVSEISRGASVEEAAFNAGYASPSAFISVFKRLFGETPGKLLKAN